MYVCLGTLTRAIYLSMMMIVVSGWRTTDASCGDESLEVEVDKIPCLVLFHQLGLLSGLPELPDSICTDSAQPAASYV